VFENAIQQSNFHYVMTLDGVIASRGGIPLVQAGKLIGAIGCSGGTGSQDEVACKVGAATNQVGLGRRLRRAILKQILKCPAQGGPRARRL